MSNTLCCAMRVEPFGSTSNGERVPSFFSTHHLHIIPNLNLSVMKKISEGGTRAMGNHQRGLSVLRFLDRQLSDRSRLARRMLAQRLLAWWLSARRWPTGWLQAVELYPISFMLLHIIISFILTLFNFLRSCFFNGSNCNKGHISDMARS